MRRRSPARHSQSGVTLIEVMVGMVLVGLLAIGMNAVWESAARQLDDVSLRQRAIFRLNGEMERLSALYIFSDGNGPANKLPVDYAAGAPARTASYITDATANQRFIYGPTSASGVNGPVPVALSVFEKTVDADGQNAETVYGAIHHLDAGVPSTTTDDRNLVWLDREHDVLAQISWKATPLPNTDPTGTTPCDAASCTLLTLFLDYPFRYVGGAADPRGDMGPVETITLQTIVGHRP